MSLVLAYWRRFYAFLYDGFTRAPESFTHTTGAVSVDVDWSRKPGAVLDAEGVTDAPTHYRDDSTAQAARRLIEFMGS